MRNYILKILQDHPSGNLSPLDVRKEIFRLGDMPTEKFVRDYMELVCEPSVERSNRRYILL